VLSFYQFVVIMLNVKTIIQIIKHNSLQDSKIHQNREHLNQQIKIETILYINHHQELIKNNQENLVYYKCLLFYQKWCQLISQRINKIWVINIHQIKTHNNNNQQKVNNHSKFKFNHLLIQWKQINHLLIICNKIKQLSFLCK